MLLRTLVEAHVELGQPVGSKWLAERSDVKWSSSTIRYELAALEEPGYLNHPHTSAGRVPTDAGYRYYADTVLHEGPLPAPPASGSTSSCPTCGARWMRRCASPRRRCRR